MRHSSVWIIVLALGYVCPVSLGAQGDPVAEEMESWREQRKRHLSRLLDLGWELADRGRARPRIPDSLLTDYPEDALDVLEKYRVDDAARRRLEAYRYIYMVGRSSRDSAVRKRVVSRLVDGCRDSVGWQGNAQWLLEFRKHEFTPEARTMLREFVVKEPIRDDVLLVLGVARMDEMDNWLRKISDRHFNAVLALARLGDDDAARRAVAHVDKIENVGVRVGRWLDKLGYTRHPIALEYIASYLDNEEGEITLAQSGDYYRAPFNKTALDVIAKHFPDCPVKRQDFVGRYSDEDFTRVRDWLKRQPKGE